ncbi:MAG TPA: hypothetical protein VGB37_15140 [Candidatus Lokiarchaeia archaeon]
MKCQNKITSRSYIISQKELKNKLDLIGDIQSMSLWSGLNQFQEEQGESHDKDEWEIITREIENYEELI